MKKAICHFCLFVIMIFSSYSLELENTLWGTENGEFGYYISFETDNRFYFGYAGEGGGQNVTGTYTQNGNDIILKTEVINEWGSLPNYIKQKTVVFSIMPVANSIFSLYKLVGQTDAELYSRSHKPEEGATIRWDGKEIIVTAIIWKKVVENARFRVGPGLNYNYQTFMLVSYYKEFGNVFERVYDEISSVPKNTSIEILAYASDKDSIDGQENYWYYCRLSNTVYSRIYGWIWGELLQ